MGDQVGEGEGEVEGEKGETGEQRLARARELLAGLRLGEVWRAVVASFGEASTAGGGPGGTGGDGRKQAGEPAAAAVAGLRGGLPKGLGDRGPRITLRGLVSMQAPKQAAVLYAPPVDQFGLLQAFCERVRDVFREADLMVDDGRPLLLHATVVNTVYVKGGGREANSNEPGEGSSSSTRRGGRGGRGGRGRKKWERLVFDATGVLDRYEDQVWMEDVPVSKVAICKMGAKKVVIDGEEDEAYEVDAEVAFE
ncbi:uncharacterized protein THITE_2124321 [Thermothielavioides terrestris NRRL 8126]|uniref:A-kinase anchor protein 7-like phosphoesterase domain-containing protein n=1 Tax=Thermothielavioides terrestris (strain ATCC 38088 / NRRL 8126) TaxID=578455 RepID=G2RFP5_THETT|nr:uncharacterized protein THITE_2124321 [Thermothielavioides terrestris NRRL 8126]AEO71649.1 hypothetical protein THITE_2124321 [Thermothielavioides terrestris NRRL 8126]